MSYLFGGDNLPQSAEELERLRKIAAAMDSRRRAPRTIGEGIYALGDGLITGIERNRQNAAERTGRAQANEQFNGLLMAPDQVRGSAGDAPVAPPSMDGPNPSLIRNESGGRWDAQNNVMGAGGMRGHFGRLQFGQARLQEAMQAGAIPPGTTPQQFMASPELQQAAERWHFGDIDNFVSRQGLDRFVGQQIGGVPVTREGMRAVAHLGGNNGLARFLQTGGQYNPADANGTRLSDYLMRHGRPDRVSGDEGEAMPAPAQMTEAPTQAPVPIPRPAMPAPQQAVAQAMAQRPMEMMARQQQPQMSERDRLMLLRDEGSLAPGEADQLRAGLGNPVAEALMARQQVPAQAPAQQQAPLPVPAPQAAVAQAMVPQAAQSAQAPAGQASLQSLMAVAQNPWLSEQQRTVVNAMLAQRMKPQEFGFQNVQGLGLVRTDPRTGQVSTVAEVPRAPVPLGRDQRLVDASGRQIAGPDNAPQYRPVTDPQERARLGIPADDRTPYQVDRDGKLSAIGRAQTSVSVNNQSESEFDKKLGGQQAEMFGQMLSQGTQVQSDLSDIGQLRELAASSPTGLSGAAVRLAGNLGIAVPGASEVQAFEAIVNRLVPGQRPPGSGTMSDKDVELFRSSLPRLINQPGGNQRILDTMEGMARYKQTQYEIARDVASGQLSRRDALDRLAKIPNPLEWIRSQRPGGQQTSAPPQPGQAPQTRAPTGFRIIGVE